MIAAKRVVILASIATDGPACKQVNARGLTASPWFVRRIDLILP